MRAKHTLTPNNQKVPDPFSGYGLHTMEGDITYLAPTPTIILLYPMYTNSILKLSDVIAQDLYYIEYEDGEEVTCDRTSVWRTYDEVPETFRNMVILRSDNTSKRINSTKERFYYTYLGINIFRITGGGCNTGN